MKEYQHNTPRTALHPNASLLTSGSSCGGSEHGGQERKGAHDIRVLDMWCVLCVCGVKWLGGVVWRGGRRNDHVGTWYVRRSYCWQRVKYCFNHQCFAVLYYSWWHFSTGPETLVSSGYQKVEINAYQVASYCTYTARIWYGYHILKVLKNPNSEIDVHLHRVLCGCIPLILYLSVASPVAAFVLHFKIQKKHVRIGKLLVCSIAIEDGARVVSVSVQWWSTGLGLTETY